MTVIGKIADQRFCPIHGVPLSEGMSERTRTSEDIVDGKWIKTVWTIHRRYYKKCKRQHSPDIEGILADQHFGVGIMSIVAAMWCLAIPFGKIQKIIHMMYAKV